MKNQKELVFAILAVIFVLLIINGERIDRTKVDMVKITGFVENNIGDTVLFRASDSTYITTLDTVTGIFSIEFEWDSAAYVSFVQGMESTKMYIKPNDEIQLTINTERFDETIKYTGSDECNYLAWQFLYNEKMEWPNFIDLPLEEVDSTFRSTIEPFVMRAERFQDSNPDFYASILSDYDASIEYIKNRIEALAALPQHGEDAIDFTYPDMDGNEISLSDYVGSFVYVDVWATWCGPCILEIPHLTELEEDYHGKNITFIGISVDRDSVAWKSFVDENAMQGIHLNTGGWQSQLMDDYSINGIPRFMLFDDYSKVVDLDAPRPSSDEIRPLLDSLLRKE
ncbi:MAG: hypothetical protein CL847_01275 [Crocinitomicaceae bacterium]|nr:hypothetical protein [Crocinitomicaceae bacterium]